MLPPFTQAVSQILQNPQKAASLPGEELHHFAELLDQTNYEQPLQKTPPNHPVPGLRHLTPTIQAALENGHADLMETLRPVIGLTPWGTFYEKNDWSNPFIDNFACGELIGPAGYLPNQQVSLGLFIIGPDTLYSEHAHDSKEIYYVVSGGAEWAIDREDNKRWAGPGEIVYTSPHQRHSIQTGTQPLLAIYSWKEDPAAGTYYYEHGPWRGGNVVPAALMI